MTLPKLSLMQGILVRAELAARLEEAAPAPPPEPSPAPADDLAEVCARIAKLEAQLPELACAPTASPAHDAVPEYLTTRQAAALLGVSVKHLEGLRARGGGPPHVRIGHAVRYPAAELRSKK